MHIITRKALLDFAAKHADAAGPLDAWYRLMKARKYTSPAEVEQDFPYVSFLGGTKACFNIGGNKYRLLVNVRYDMGKVFIRDVLTHAEYDRRAKAGTL